MAMTRETAVKLFEHQHIRAEWDAARQTWYFAIVDVIRILTDSPNARTYWSVLKTRLKKEGSQLATNCSQLKMQAADGKFYKTDVADTEQLLRLVQSIPSPKAEPFKRWLAQVGYEHNNSLPQRGRVGEGELSPTTEIKLFIPAPVPKPLLAAARTLRSTMTDAEQLLWSCLRRKQLGGYRFRRQHPIDRFVLDFYCSETKFAVELDGGQHNTPDAYLQDQERTTFLGKQGIKVIRFWNNEVFSNTDGVLESIYLALQQLTPVPLPSPPPLGEGAQNMHHTHETATNGHVLNIHEESDV